MKIKCPYSKLELDIAALGIDKVFEGQPDSKLEEMAAKVNEINESIKDLTGAAAQHYGITRLELLNSPNYEKLKHDFIESNFRKSIAVVKEYGLSDVQAWSLMITATGLVD